MGVWLFFSLPPSLFCVLSPRWVIFTFVSFPLFIPLHGCLVSLHAHIFLWLIYKTLWFIHGVVSKGPLCSIPFSLIHTYHEVYWSWYIRTVLIIYILLSFILLISSWSGQSLGFKDCYFVTLLASVCANNVFYCIIDFFWSVYGYETLMAWCLLTVWSCTTLWLDSIKT